MTKNKTGNNLNSFVEGTATQWQKQVENYHTNKRGIRRAQKFALELMDYMDEHNIKQNKLAELMDVSPQQVNKILRAKANLTFETLDKIEDALQVIISTPVITSKKSKSIKSSTVIYQQMQVVHKMPVKKLLEYKTSAHVMGETPLLKTTIASMNDYGTLLKQM